MSRICIPLFRISFFVVYFYFGLLKVLGLSPAEVIVRELWMNTLPFIPFKGFLNFFGAYEMLIGIIFLIPGKERIALYLLIPHMITTFGPLVFLPQYTWKAFMVPTLAGHYIIKNVIIIALGIAVASNIGDFKTKVAVRKVE
ncbi:MAG: hypothetical protein ACHQD9_00055 [Chitinophagales bacterium]